MTKDHRKLSDEELITAIKDEGKSELFGVLYDRYSDKVYRKCISFVKDKDLAQDMVQDVLLKVFTQLNKFKGKSRFSTWLYAITYNYCVEYYRKHSRITKVDIEEREDMADQEEDEKELLSARTEQLRKALDRVAPEDKMLLLMKYQDDTSIKELMEHLDISESAVKMRLARARSRVKKILEKTEN